MSPNLIATALLLGLVCTDSRAAECDIPTSSRALSGTNNTQDYKFVHVSSSQNSGGKWVVSNFILNTHQNALLPVKWEKGMMEFQNLRSGTCASSSIETFFACSEDGDAPLLYGIGAQLTKPAHAWVCAQTTGLGTFHDTTPLESKITAHLMDGERPIDVEFSVTSRLEKNTFIYGIQNRTDYPLKFDMADFAREWQGPVNRGLKWLETRRPESNIVVSGSWGFQCAANDEYSLIQRLKRVRLYSPRTGNLLGEVRVPLLVPSDQ